jgi:hypothetical protein
MIGKITRLPLREVWKHEALDFTTWLVDNADVLSDQIGITLQNVERERAAGAFSADLVAEDSDGNVVVIENQLEKSNHDHLGKIVTYLAALDARVAVWIVSDPRPEHVQAIAWLNGSRLADFYLLKVEAIRIGDSAPAPLLTLITGPSEEGADVGDTKKDIAERYPIRRRFWESLLDRAKSKTKLHANISPSSGSSISAGAGKYGISYLYTVTKHGGTAELLIDRGLGSDADNKLIFDQIKAHQSEIEQEFGAHLDWYQREGVKMCRIRYAVETGGYRDDETKWPEIQDQMIDAMIHLEKAMRPFIQKLQIN